MTVVEFRQYTLKSGQRDTLIALFEREFVESQEVLGMDVIGTFTDVGDPDRFVWLRGFADMESRARALAEFYDGPVWKAHREAAIATMIDTDNVLLLRPAWKGAGFALAGGRAPPDTLVQAPGEFAAATCCFDRPVADTFVERFRDAVAARIPEASIPALLVTEKSANTYPRLPVREDANAFLCFLELAQTETALEKLTAMSSEFGGELSEPMEVRHLRPTPRSKLHG
jgi:hypothetical protein